MTRIFQSILLAENSLIELDKAASHHLAQVLRANVGDEVTLFNGEGGEYHAIIKSITKKIVTVQLNQLVTCETESFLDLWLAQGISRAEKMDYTIQKAVELGVKKIIPLLTERCNVKLDEERRQKRWQHWQSIIIHASEQSGRACIPTLEKINELESWLHKPTNMGQGFVLTPDAGSTLKQVQPKPGSMVLLIGPEGGLSRVEVDQACQQGFKPLSLGPRILRTETAGVAALAAFQALFGDI
jgi:16S rRNA (uracil1498-N3)-methyltransferase